MATKCKVCKKETKLVKAGPRNNKQAYLCKSCGHTFVWGDDRRGREATINKEILKEALELLFRKEEFDKLVAIANLRLSFYPNPYSMNIILKKLNKKFPKQNIPTKDYLYKLAYSRGLRNPKILKELRKNSTGKEKGEAWRKIDDFFRKGIKFY